MIDPLKYLKFFVEFLLPPICIVCSKEIKEALVCNDCLNNVQLIKPPLCPVCGRPIDKTKTCSHCCYERNLDYGRAFTLYIPPVDKMIHHLKYRQKTNLARFFGRGMANILVSDFYLKQAEFLIPVPLFWWKKFCRGYNQADLLAEIIGTETKIEVLNALRRIKNTKTQTKLKQEKRRENVKDAFVVTKDIRNKKVILIDDVMTTGATIKECARMLKESGAKEVYSLVSAITPS